MRDRHLENLSYVEVREYLANGDLIVLPTGVLEPHGRHLPLGTDGHCATVVAQRLAESLDGLIAPCLHYGVIDRLAGYPGATDVSPPTYEALLRDTINSFVASGFRIIVVSNGHGPNRGPICKVAGELIKGEQVCIPLVEWYNLTVDIAQDMYGDQGGHGGIQETSMMLCAHPELVKEHLYDESDFHVVQSGLTMHPLPSAMVLMQPADKPDFDAEKAKVFAERALDKVVAEVSEAIRQYRQNLGERR